MCVCVCAVSSPGPAGVTRRWALPCSLSVVCGCECVFVRGFVCVCMCARLPSYTAAVLAGLDTRVSQSRLFHASIGSARSEGLGAGPGASGGRFMRRCCERRAGVVGATVSAGTDGECREQCQRTVSESRSGQDTGITWWGAVSSSVWYWFASRKTNEEERAFAR